MSNLTNFINKTGSAEVSVSSTTAFLNDFIDFCTTFIVPIICFYGVVANIINVIVFSKKELTDVTFKYYRINALSNIVYLLICFFLFVARCGVYCTFSRTYAAQLFLYFFYTYFKGIFAILCICVQIVVSIYRLLIVMNKSTTLFQRYEIIVAILLIFSTVFYSPILFTKEMKETVTNVTTLVNGTKIVNTVKTYSNVNNFIGNSEVGKWLIIVVVTIFIMFHPDLLHK